MDEMNIAKTRLDKIRNSDIRKEYGLQRIIEWLLRTRKEWDERIGRMQPCRLIRLARDGTVMEENRQEVLIADAPILNLTTQAANL